MNNLDNNNENIELTKQKTKLKKSILVLLIVAVIGTIGVTLASGTIDKRSRVSVDTGTYNVIITGNTSLSPSGLRPINNTSDTILPSSLSNYASSIFISDFTVKGADGNPVDEDIIYDIALIDSNIDGNLLNEYLKWELIKNNTIIANGNFKGLTNGQRYVLTDIQQDLPAYNQTADSLQLVIWINNNFPNDFDQTTMMNKSFSATIDVELYTKSKIGQQHPTDTLHYNITQGAVMDNTSSTYVSSSSGINFAAISSDTNGKGIYIRSGTENDRFPIYYFRGAVTNNNILFANFCWKIVRTTDTGGIKLIYNGTPNNGKCTNTTGDSIQIGTSKFNSYTNSLADIGYMYGTRYTSSTATGTGWYYGNDVSWNGSNYTLIADSTNTYTPTVKSTINGTNLNYYHYTCGSSTNLTCSSIMYVYVVSGSTVYYITLSNGKKIEDALSEMFDTNQTSSTIKTYIENWYSNNMTSYTDDYIEDTIYCNDRSIYIKSGWNPNGGRTDDNLYFGAYGRDFNPIVTCPRDVDKFTVSSSTGNGKLLYSVGLLTADEVRLAGGIYNGYNTSYYLYTNGDYWLVSPYNFYFDDDSVVGYFAWGHGLNQYGMTGYSGVRPVVSLKPNVKLKGGDGTANNPYTVK